MKKSFIINICVCLCFIPSYVWYAHRILKGGESGLSVLILPLVFFLAYKLKDRSSSNIWGTALGIVFYNLAWVWCFPPLIKAMIAISVMLYHWGLIKNVAIVSLSYLTLPWLDSLQFFIGYPLRCLVAEVTSMGLNSLNLEVLASGTGLLYKNNHVFVDPPCSGVKMLWAGTVLSAVLIAIFRLNWKSSSFIYLAATLLLIFSNSMRGLILFFPESNLVQWPEWAHEGVGLLIYACCVFCLISLTQRLSITQPCKQRNLTS